MTDDTQRRGLVSDLARRLALAGRDELRVVDRIALRLEQLRFTWMRRVPTSEHDIDTKWHLAKAAIGVAHTRCGGRWWIGDRVDESAAPPVLERCMACQRAAWSDSASDIDPLLAAVEELIAAEDLARKNLRDAARAEMVGAG